MVNQYEYPRMIRGQAPQKTTRAMLTLKWICLDVEVRLKLLSERRISTGYTNLITKSIPNSGNIKSKAINKLCDRLLSRWKNYQHSDCAWYYKKNKKRKDMEQKFWENHAVSRNLFNRQRIQFLKNRSYTGVSTSVLYKLSHAIYDTLSFT